MMHKTLMKLTKRHLLYLRSCSKYIVKSREDTNKEALFMYCNRLKGYLACLSNLDTITVHEEYSLYSWLVEADRTNSLKYYLRYFN